MIYFQFRNEKQSFDQKAPVDEKKWTVFYPQGIGNGDPTDAFPCFGIIFPQIVWSLKLGLWTEPMVIL